MPRSVLFGRRYRLMHAEELRAGLVLWPEPLNVPCVHDLGGFVKCTGGAACYCLYGRQLYHRRKTSKIAVRQIDRTAMQLRQFARDR